MRIPSVAIRASIYLFHCVQRVLLESSSRGRIHCGRWSASCNSLYCQRRRQRWSARGNCSPSCSGEGVPRRQPHRRSSLATLPSVGSVP